VQAFNGSDTRYVYYVLRYLGLKRFDTGSANPTINRSIIHPEIVAFPPPHEQGTIAAFLDTELDQIVRAIGTTQREISLLREYRTRLIADVVTGKLDVRTATTKLPDELTDKSNEAEPLHDDSLAGSDEATIGDYDAEPQETQV
jgi:type I restriction enzyme S subunit